jgi:hypothetical protein
VKVGVRKKRITNSVKVTQNRRRSANRRRNISETRGITGVIEEFDESGSRPKLGVGVEPGCNGMNHPERNANGDRD